MNILSVVLAFLGVWFATPPVFAAEPARLPYPAGARFVVTVGYNTPPTHIKKDAFAIDISQEGCRAYGTPVVAALAGTALVVSEDGYNGGYGTQVLVRSSDGTVARYAHLLAGSIPVRQGDAVPRGAILGALGNTGMVAGAACAEHPGTHLHFAIYQEGADGTFTARNPEPLSGFTDIKVGSWYLSDNAIAATNGNLAALVALVGDFIGHTSTTVESTAPAVVAASPAPVSSSRPIVTFPSPSVTALPEEGSASPLSMSSPLPIAATAATPSDVSSSIVSSPSSVPYPETIGPSSPTDVAPTTSAVPPSGVWPAGGGRGSSGGVTVMVPSQSARDPVTSSTSIRENDYEVVASDTPVASDDPMDDTVAACTVDE
jgi:hypothetical protein